MHCVLPEDLQEAAHLDTDTYEAAGAQVACCKLDTLLNLFLYSLLTEKSQASIFLTKQQISTILPEKHLLGPLDNWYDYQKYYLWYWDVDSLWYATFEKM